MELNREDFDKAPDGAIEVKASLWRDNGQYCIRLELPVWVLRDMVAGGNHARWKYAFICANQDAPALELISETLSDLEEE